jgi:prefoldin subunit 5
MKYKRGELKRLVVEAMGSHPTRDDHTARQLSVELNIPTMQISRCLRNMRRAGTAVSLGPKGSHYQKWKLTSSVVVPIRKVEEVEVVEDLLPTAEEIVEAFINKIDKLEAQIVDDGQTITQLIDEKTQLEKEVDRVKKEFNERKTLVRRLVDRV